MAGENVQNTLNVNPYLLAIESYENLEFLFHTDPVDLIIVTRELLNCCNKIDLILAMEKENFTHTVALCQLKQEAFALMELIDNTIKQLSNKAIHVSPPSSQTDSNKTSSQKLLRMVEGTIETPRVKGFEEIAGLGEVKKILKTFVVLPRTQPQLFVGQKVSNSVLLFGPPGTGKTHIVHALAFETKARFHSVSVSDIVSSFVGESERGLRFLFEYIRNSDTFSIIFIDEIDGFCRKRNNSEQEYSRRLKTELMCQMSKMENCSNFFLICATNCPWDLDSAFLRRFQKTVYIPLPNQAERYELIRLFLKNTPIEMNTSCLDYLVTNTYGYSGSDLSNLVQQALNVSILELEDTNIWKTTPDGLYQPASSKSDVTKDNPICCKLSDLPPNSVRARNVQAMDFLISLNNITVTVSEEEIKRYEDFNCK